MTFAGGSDSQMLPTPDASQSPDSVNLVAPAFSRSIGAAACAIATTATANRQPTIASLKDLRTAASIS
jgi:hypothetical protein